jgi:hypothetical protein
MAAVHKRALLQHVPTGQAWGERQCSRTVSWWRSPVELGQLSYESYGNNISLAHIMRRSVSICLSV